MKQFAANGSIVLTVLSILVMPARAEQPLSGVNSITSVDANAMIAWSNGLRWNGLRWNGLPSSDSEGQSQPKKPVKAKAPIDSTNPFSGLADQPLGK